MDPNTKRYLDGETIYGTYIGKFEFMCSLSETAPEGDYSFTVSNVEFPQNNAFRLADDPPVKEKPKISLRLLDNRRVLSYNQERERDFGKRPENPQNRPRVRKGTVTTYEKRI